MAQTTIQLVVTDLGRERLAKSLIGVLGGFPHTELDFFQIGEGGFVETINGRVPKNPDPSRTELEATGVAGDFLFEKAFTASDLQFIASPSPRVQVTAFVGLAEANDDGLGDSPRFFEIGLFDQDRNLLVYGTFPEETKSPDKTLNHIITIVF